MFLAKRISHKPKPRDEIMDLASFFGLIAATGLIALAIVTGGTFELFIDPQAMMVVMGGTFGACMVHYPFHDVWSAIKVGKNAFFYKENPPIQVIERLIRFANVARKEGLLSLEGNVKEVKDDDFFAKGLQMAADGQEPETMRRMMEKELEYIHERHEKGADIFTALGGYAPAMGMVGTLIGLVQMLAHLDDPSRIGPAMSMALLTTLYGTTIGNIIFHPMAGKLRNRNQTEILKKSMIIEGIHSILVGENPRIMEQKLHSFLPPKERKSVFR